MLRTKSLLFFFIGNPRFLVLRIRTTRQEFSFWTRSGSLSKALSVKVNLLSVKKKRMGKRGLPYPIDVKGQMRRTRAWNHHHTRKTRATLPQLIAPLFLFLAASPAKGECPRGIGDEVCSGRGMCDIFSRCHCSEGRDARLARPARDQAGAVNAGRRSSERWRRRPDRGRRP